MGILILEMRNSDLEKSALQTKLHIGIPIKLKQTGIQVLRADALLAAVHFARWPDVVWCLIMYSIGATSCGTRIDHSTVHEQYKSLPNATRKTKKLPSQKLNKKQTQSQHGKHRKATLTAATSMLRQVQRNEDRTKTTHHRYRHRCKTLGGPATECGTDGIV
jgi:hypothetical protein